MGGEGAWDGELGIAIVCVLFFILLLSVANHKEKKEGGKKGKERVIEISVK